MQTVKILCSKKALRILTEFCTAFFAIVSHSKIALSVGRSLYKIKGRGEEGGEKKGRGREEREKGKGEKLQKGH